MSNSIGDRMADVERKSWGTISKMIGYVVYAGGVAYAEARAFSLFTKNLDADLLIVAIVGIVALGLTAVGAPLAYHWGTVPGTQRKWLVGFYAFDIAAMAANAVLDAAMHSADVTDILNLWRVYVLPALPLLCLLGWAVFMMIDPSHKRRDAIRSALDATEDEIAEKVVEEMRNTDITATVRKAAKTRANAIAARVTGIQVESVKETTKPTTATLPKPTTATLPTLPAPIEPSHETVREVAAPASPKADSKNGTGSH